MKLVLVEDGSDLAAELWDGPGPAASSILSYPEGRAALSAGRHKGRITAREHARATAAFETLRRELLLIGIDLRLAREAGALADEFRLRGDDAVHLATARALGDETTVVTWDRALAHAARGTGCGVAPAP